MIVLGVKFGFEECEEQEKIIDNRDVKQSGDKHGVASPGTNFPTCSIDEDGFGMGAPD